MSVDIAYNSSGTFNPLYPSAAHELCMFMFRSQGVSIPLEIKGESEVLKQAATDAAEKAHGLSPLGSKQGLDQTRLGHLGEEV